MGGGDLNLKKSWHPSTMKNMEKVWKAEQQDNEEKKRIAELKREIALERDKEEMKAFAMDQGVIEKKEDKKLDWMYKGPNEAVNREEYLLGRPIDKQFEQLAQAEKDAVQNKPVKNHVEHECIPPSLRFFSGNEQVDLARKLQEDPLYAIKKREMETRSQLLKNPVKLKQLRQLVAQQTNKLKDNKVKKKTRKKSSSDSDQSTNDSKLDDLLAAKYKKLKGKINEKDLIKSLKKRKKHKKIKKRKKNNISDSEDSESYSSSSDESMQRRKKLKKHKKKEELKKNDPKHCSKRDNDFVKHHDSTNYQNKHDNRSTKSTTIDSDEDRHLASNSKSYGLMKADGTKIYQSKGHTSIKDKGKADLKSVKIEQKWIPPKKTKLSEEEKERRRKEMMMNASLYDKQRERNVKKYEEEEKKESAKEKSFDQDFMKKHLALATNHETVASRIKSNINNIQRFKHSMDKNFAKR